MNRRRTRFCGRAKRYKGDAAWPSTAAAPSLQLSSLKLPGDGPGARPVLDGPRKPPYLFLRVKTLISQRLAPHAYNARVPVSARGPAETGTAQRQAASQKRVRCLRAETARGRRNGYGGAACRFAETGTAKPGFQRVEAALAPYLFLRVAAQKRVRISTRMRPGIVLSQKRVRSRRRRPAGRRVHVRGVSGIMRIPRAGRPRAWPACSPSFHSHEQYFDRATFGRRNLAKSRIARTAGA